MRVTIGRVVKPHGLHGEVVVAALTDVAERFAPSARVVLDGRDARIATSRPHQGRVLVRFEGIADRTAAESLRGAQIEAEALDTAEYDTYFAHELVGARVFGRGGVDLGTVCALIEIPAAAGYDLLEVERPDGVRWLLPAADDLVEAVEDAEGQVELRLTPAAEGLVALDDPAPGDRPGS